MQAHARTLATTGLAEASAPASHPEARQTIEVCISYGCLTMLNERRSVCLVWPIRPYSANIPRVAFPAPQAEIVSES